MAPPSGNRSRAGSDAPPAVPAGAPALGGLFAGGMPTLKKTSGGVRLGGESSPVAAGGRAVSQPVSRPPPLPGQSPAVPAAAPSKKYDTMVQGLMLII